VGDVLTKAELIARRDKLFGRGAPLFYREPIHLERGDGVWLFDVDGRRYLDMYNNIPVVGHCNQRVVEAIAKQAATLNIHSRYLHTAIFDYAERLLGLHSEQIDNVIFACTGTEANEIAMQMARLATGGQGFICTDATYHGNSTLVGSLTLAPRRGRQDVHAIPFPQMYRPIKEGLTGEQLADAYLDEVASAISDFATEGVRFAGIILCSILANEGLPNLPPTFMPRAAKMVRDAGGLVIMDEVQAGFGRTGNWWGYQLVGVEPDIVTMGKPMGNGLPLAACAARSDLVEKYRTESQYFNTFSSSPVHAAAGMAVLDEIDDRNLLVQVTQVGEYLLRELQKISQHIDQIGDVRGFGMFLGVEWVKDKASREPDMAGAIDIANRLKDKGVLVSNDGVFLNVLKIRPPLVFERSHADIFLTAFRETMADIGA